MGETVVLKLPGDVELVFNIEEGRIVDVSARSASRKLHRTYKVGRSYMWKFDDLTINLWLHDDKIIVYYRGRVVWPHEQFFIFPTWALTGLTIDSEVPGYGAGRRVHIEVKPSENVLSIHCEKRWIVDVGYVYWMRLSKIGGLAVSAPTYLQAGKWHKFGVDIYGTPRDVTLTVGYLEGNATLVYVRANGNVIALTPGDTANISAREVTTLIYEVKELEPDRHIKLEVSLV